jgi:hypothetical protein
MSQKLRWRIAETVTSIVETSLPAGSVFAGRYRIERVIAHGDHKWTYLASDMKARRHRQFALAVMEPGSDPSASQREVEMMGKVGPHDYIVLSGNLSPTRTSWWRSRFPMSTASRSAASTLAGRPGPCS